MDQKKQTIIMTILRAGKRRGLVLLFVLSLILSDAGGMGAVSAQKKQSRPVSSTRKHAGNQRKESSAGSNNPYSVTIDGVSYPVGGVSVTEVGSESVEEAAARTSSDKKTNSKNKSKKIKSVRTGRKNAGRPGGGINLNADLSTPAKIYDNVLKYGASWYGYYQLDDDQKKLYDKYYEAAESFAKSGENFDDYDCDDWRHNYSSYQGSSAGMVHTVAEIDLNTIGLSSGSTMELVKAYEAYCTFARDNPQFFWLRNRFQYLRNSAGVTTVYPCVHPDYLEASKRNAVETQIVQDMKDLFEPAIRDADSEAAKRGYGNNEKTYLRIKAIHDVIVNTVNYYHDSTGKPSGSIEAHSIIGFFKSDLRLVVCEGYAKVFELVNNFYDIPCILVCGKTKKDETQSTGYSGYHAWNMVSYDGGLTYYDVDTTWDDAGANSNHGQLGYSWYMPTHEIFTQAHYTDINTGNTKKSGLNAWNNQSGWTFTLPDNKSQIPANDPRDPNIHPTMGREPSSYFAWFGADLKDNTVTTYAQARDTLNGYLRKESEKRWLTIVGRKDPMWMAVQLLGLSSYNYYHWDSFGGAGYRRFHFDRPVKSIRFDRDAWDEDCVTGVPNPESKYVTVTDWKDKVYTKDKVRLTNIRWYSGDVTAVANPTNPLSEKPDSAGQYTIIADVEVSLGIKQAAGMYLYGGELREVVNINDAGSPIHHVDIELQGDVNTTQYRKEEVHLKAKLFADETTELDVTQYFVTYQWFEVSENGDVKPITGATGDTYTPNDEDAGLHWYYVMAYVPVPGSSGAVYAEGSDLVAVTVTQRVLTADDLEFTSGPYTKVYDGTKTSYARVQAKANVFSTGAVPVAGVAEYNDVNAGSGKTITFTPYAVETANYKIASTTTFTTTGAITQRAQSVTPARPVITTITKDSISVQKKTDANKYQYACVFSTGAPIESDWQTFPDSTIRFDELAADTEYTIYARFASDGANCVTSNASAGVTVKTLSDNTINLLDANVVLEKDTYKYTGDEIEPDIKKILVEKNGEQINIWTDQYIYDFYYMYYDNVDPGTGYVIIEPSSDNPDFTGVAIGTFTIDSYQPTAAPIPHQEGGSGGGGAGGGSGGSSGGSSGSDMTPAPTATVLPSASPVVTEKPASSTVPGGSGVATPTVTPSATSLPSATPAVKVETETDKDGKVIATVTTTIERKPDGSATTTVNSEYTNGDRIKTVLEEPAKGNSTIVVEEKTGKTTRDYHYNVMENGKLRVTSVNSNGKKWNIKIPDSVTVAGKTYKVTVIKKGLFSKNKKLKKITFGKYAKRIEKKALYKCSNLKQIIITSGKLEYIGPKAFEGLPKNAVVRIRAGKKRFRKIVKLIRASGGAGLRYRRIK